MESNSVTGRLHGASSSVEPDKTAKVKDMNMKWVMREREWAR